MKYMRTTLGLFLFSLLFVCFVTKVQARKKPVLRGNTFRRFRFRLNRRVSDEFNGKRLNKKKWLDYNKRWAGRQPGLFLASNVKQGRGKLKLFGRFERDRKVFADAPDGYKKYTTSYVQSNRNMRYGYYEIRAKPGNSRLSSAFWGSLDTPDLWTEIDVFEIGGGAKRDGIDFRKRVNMNLHLFRSKKLGIAPGEGSISRPTYYTHSRYLRSSFNTYGVDWNRRKITWVFNGRKIREDKNDYWHQAFPWKFDVETMPHWFGLPSRRTLPAVYKVDYFRAWSRKRKSKARNGIRMLNTSDHQMSDLLGNLNSFNNPSQDSVPNEDNDDDDDDADIEIDDSGQTESNPPVDGLQRAPVPGSNEHLYMPVVPLGGGSWDPIIDRVNSLMDDVPGIEIEPDEGISLSDFTDEIVEFTRPGASNTNNSPSSTPASDDTPVAAPQSSSPASAPMSGLQNFNVGLNLGALGR